MANLPIPQASPSSLDGTPSLAAAGQRDRCLLDFEHVHKSSLWAQSVSCSARSAASPCRSYPASDNDPARTVHSSRHYAAEFQSHHLETDHLRWLQWPAPGHHEISTMCTWTNIALLGPALLRFHIFSRRCSAHGQPAVIAPERRQSEQEHQRNEADEEARNVVGKEESWIVFVHVPTEIRGQHAARRSDHAQDRARENEIEKVTIIQQANAIVD